MNRFVPCTLAGLTVLALSAGDSFAQVSRGGYCGYPKRTYYTPPRTCYTPRPVCYTPVRTCYTPVRTCYVPPRACSTQGTCYTQTPCVTPCYQTVRYLRVVNCAGQDLTIYVKLNPCDQPWTWSIPAGQATYLAVDGQPLATSAAYIWAASCDGRQWNGYKDNTLALVTAPYQSSQVGTYSFTFNP